MNQCGRLNEIPLDESHDALESGEGKQPKQRLLTVIAYKHGVPQAELAEWHDTGRRTIYNWLTRLDTDEPLDETVPDTHYSGRTQKLSEEALKEFQQTVRESPQEAGYDEPSWTTRLVRHHLNETYDIEYSTPNCRRWLKEAGLSYQKPRHENAKADPGDREEFDETRDKSAGGWTPP